MENLEAVATASIPPREALHRLRNWLSVSAERDQVEAAETAYEALRSVVWQFVSNRSGHDELRGWADVILRTRQLMHLRKWAAAERLTALYDMLDQTIRFREQDAIREVVTARHAMAILASLNEHGKSMPRQQLAASVKLRDSNLSRILSNLAAEGLIGRRPQGREVMVHLTEQGAAKVGGTRANLIPDVLADAAVSGSAARSIVANLWHGLGVPMAVWDPGGSLLACDRGFASLFGIDDGAALGGVSKDVLARHFDKAGPGSGDTGREMTTPDNRVLRLEANDTTRGSLWLMTDVTTYRRGVDELSAKNRVLQRREEHAIAQPPRDALYDKGEVARWALALLGDHRQGLLSMVGSINVYAELMRREAFGILGNEKHAEYLSEIATRSEQVHSLLADIIAVDPLVLEFPHLRGEVQPRTVIERVIGQTTDKAKALNIFVSYDMHTVEQVVTSEKLLSAVVFHMISGSLDLSTAGSTVELGAQVRGNHLVLSAKGWRNAPSKYRTVHSYMAVCEGLVRSYGGDFDFKAAGTSNLETTVTIPIFAHAGRERRR